MAQGCETVGCIVGFLLGGGLIAYVSSTILSRAFHISRVVSVPVAIVATVAFIAAVALICSWSERRSILRDVRRWNTWKCGTCSKPYGSLKRDDAILMVRRVYTVDRGSCHTNERLVRLLCRDCKGWTAFELNGTPDTFKMDEKVTLVGGHDLEVAIPEEPESGQSRA